MATRAKTSILRLCRLAVRQLDIRTQGVEQEVVNLSGGNQQKVVIAKWLATQPRILILDEPTSSLDVITQIQILKMIKDIQRKTNTAILYISHDLITASLFCDRIAVLHDATIVEVAAARELLMNPRHPYTQKTVLHTFQQELE